MEGDSFWSRGFCATLEPASARDRERVESKRPPEASLARWGEHARARPHLAAHRSNSPSSAARHACELGAASPAIYTPWLPTPCTVPRGLEAGLLRATRPTEGRRARERDPCGLQKESPLDSLAGIRGWVDRARGRPPHFALPGTASHCRPLEAPAELFSCNAFLCVQQLSEKGRQKESL